MLGIWNKHNSINRPDSDESVRDRCVDNMRDDSKGSCGENEWKEFCGCQAFNASMETRYQSQKTKCYKKESVATELFAKYKTEVDAQCPPIPDPHCNSKDRSECTSIPDKLCEGYIIEKLQRKQDLMRDLYNVTTPDGSDYALQENNNKCKFQVTDQGPIDVRGDGVDFDHYYDPPLVDSTNKDIKGYGESESSRLLKKFKSRHPSHSSDRVSYMNYYQNPIGEDVSATQREQNREVDPCDGSTYAPYLENSRVIPLTGSKDIPCSEPLLPWLQDGQSGDDRHYCKKQSEPCKNCGVLQDGDIYRGEEGGAIDGPNRVPVGKKSSHPIIGWDWDNV